MEAQPAIEGDLESAAVAIVGRLVFAFSRFEFNLGLCLRDLVGGRNVDLVTPREREVFTQPRPIAVSQAQVPIPKPQWVLTRIRN